jgi:CHAT domain-containing protein
MVKKNTFWFILAVISFFNFQKPTPVQPSQTLEREFAVLLDSLEKYKYSTFEKAVERTDFLIRLSGYREDWEIYCRVLNIKVILAERYDKVDLIEPFINDFEKKLNGINRQTFIKHRSYKSEIQARKSELYSLSNQPVEAIRVSEEIINGIKNKTLEFEDNSKALQGAYYDLGYWTSEIGQILQGIDFLLISKQLNETDPTRELDFAIMVNGQIAKRYLNLGQYEQSFTFNRLAYNAAKQLYRKEGITPQNANYFTSNYHAISKYYIQINKIDSALIYLEKAQATASTDHIAQNYLLQAQCFTKLKRWQLAEKTLNKAISVIGNNFEVNGTQKPQIYLQLAQLKHQQRQPVVALSYCQKALKVLDPQFDTNRLQNTPTVARVLMKKELLEVLQFKSKILQEMATQADNYALPCYENALFAAQLIDSIRSDYTADFDKQYLAQVSYPIYETALDIAFQLYEKEKKDAYLIDILAVMEKSKAIVLLNNLQRGQAETGLSESDRVKIYQFRKELSTLDKQIFDLNAKGVALTDTALRRLETERALLNRTYADFTVEIEKKYPNFAPAKRGSDAISIADIRKLLPENGLYVAYFVGENSIYSLAMDAKNAKVFKTQNPQKLPQLVESIRQSIRPFSRDDDRTDIKTYCESASELYDWLLKGPLSINAQKPDFLVVSPDGALNFIPLDILLTQKPTANPNYRTLPYLLQQTSVSYVPSATIWQAQKQIPHNRATELFVGFAPQYQYNKPIVGADLDKYKDYVALAEKSGELVDMPNARREVADISKQLGASKTFIGASATEDNFVKYAPNFRILHLSMHAESNAKNPAFSQFIFSQNDTLSSHNRLFMNELQNQKLKADLVVLSACETGFGTLSKGEGVMSFARTFAAIGVPTSVVSLWKIPSGATENVLTKFYTYLNQRQSVVQSLRQSKLDYLQTAALNSPYYWAGLIPVGDTEYAPIGNKNGRWLVLILAVVVGLCGYVFYSKKKPKVEKGDPSV